MKPRTKAILWLCALGVVDVIIPLPVVAVVCVYIVIRRPPWFRELVEDMYQDA